MIDELEKVHTATDSYTWITRVIDSCTVGDHLDYCRRIIELFESRYPGEKVLSYWLQEAMINKDASILIKN